MGEAKRRRKSDPYFGLQPKKGRGIFLSAPVEVSEEKVALKSSNINPAELRRAVLFWDRLVWPDSKIVSLGSNSDEQFLEKERILERPRPSNLNDEAGVGNMAALIRVENSTGISLGGEKWKLFAKQHVGDYLSLEAREPGQWVLAEGTTSLLMKADNFVKGRGQLLTLARAIPLPDPKFPLHDLLEFKEKRKDEIFAVNYELDKFYSQIATTSDPEFELNRLISVVDRQCADLIKASRESKRPFHIGDISVSLSVDGAESMINRIIAWETGVQTALGLPIVGAVLGASASVLTVGRGFGSKQKRDRSSPFSIAGSMHDELIT